MDVLDAIFLPADVVLVPAGKLPKKLRQKLRASPTDWVITRPGLRTASLLVDARSADLLALFRQSRTIVDAVLAASRTEGTDPEVFLGDAFPMLERLLSAGFLVPEGDASTEGILPSLGTGDRFGDFEVRSCVQALADLEVFQVSGPHGLAALKLERPAGGAETRQSDALPFEASVLRRLRGSVAPRLLASGRRHGRRFLALEWVPGVDAATAAAELREAGDRKGLLALACAIAGAYAELHAQGVLHGDVHGSNLLVNRRGEVRLVDFGYARLARAGRRRPGIGRGGIGFFFEPEYAAAALAGTAPPLLHAAGEEYSLAALLFLLATGEHYLDFSLEREAMLRQIAESPPLPFAARGVRSWPEMELVLGRSLRKPPAERHGTVRKLAAALAQVPSPPHPARARRGESALRALLERTLSLLDPFGALFGQAIARPSASVNLGMAGIACGLYRIALAREEPRWLSAADLWAVKAVAVGESEEGFYDPEHELPREVVGRVSPYHAATGPLAVQALVAHALGDNFLHHEASSAFARRAGEACESSDLTLGRSGVLLSSAMLLDLCPRDSAGAAPLRALGRQLLAALWQELDRLPPIASQLRASLGIAHGWAGYAYASLRWCRSDGCRLPPGVEPRLLELAELALSWRRGFRWQWLGVPQQPWEVASMPGWCNGSAGFVHLWLLAEELGVGPPCAELAEGAAWNAWETPNAGRDLCCGLAGRSYALVAMHRSGNHGTRWLERARLLAVRAALLGAAGEERVHSLYRGELGLAVLAADLERPESAVMPFFGDEGWRSARDRPSVPVG